MTKFLKAPSEFTQKDYEDHPAIPSDPRSRQSYGYLGLRDAGFELIDIDEQIKNCGDTLIMTVPGKLEGYELRQALRGIAQLKPDECDFYPLKGLDDRTEYVRLWWD